MTIPLLALLQNTGVTRLNILVKFDKGPCAERKVTGSNPGRINTQTLKIAEKKVRLLFWHLQNNDHVFPKKEPKPSSPPHSSFTLRVFVHGIVIRSAVRWEWEK